MNKEHFLIELKIYLKVLPPAQQQQILAHYDLLFDQGAAEGQTEEQVAKELGKPRTIAEEILQEYGLEIKDKPLNPSGWVEIQPEAAQNGPEVVPHPYIEDPQPTPPPSTFVHIMQIIGLFAINFFFVFWMILGVLGMWIGAWVGVLFAAIAPFLGIGTLFFFWNTAAFFQVFLGIFLGGVGIIGFLLLLPISRGLWFLLKKYTRWNLRILRGGTY
jgi:Predicted membrane protein